MNLILPGLSCLLALFACWLAWQLARQNGRVLLRLDALEKRLAPAEPASEPSAPRGLAVGTEAPAFELRDLAGHPRALSQWRGRDVLLIFFNPRCGFCEQMAPRLASLPAEGDGLPVPVVVTTGSAEENETLIRKHNVRCQVLLDERGEVAARYEAQGTPMGYLIDAHGRIASELAVGAEALLALARGERGAAADPLHAPPVRNGHRSHHGNRSLEDSRLNRDGLSTGTPAPAFRLPDLNGGYVALDDYRGRRVLLVFSDPACGPCDLLAPQLEAAFGVRGVPATRAQAFGSKSKSKSKSKSAVFGVGSSAFGQLRSGPATEHRTPNTAPAVLMVTRGDIDANRRKAEAAGLTFPVCVQRQWEVSRLYAMFATPIAYLIDEQGTIAAEVAVGVEPILSLLAGAGGGGRAPLESPRAVVEMSA